MSITTSNNTPNTTSNINSSNPADTTGGSSVKVDQRDDKKSSKKKRSARTPEEFVPPPQPNDHIILELPSQLVEHKNKLIKVKVSKSEMDQYKLRPRPIGDKVVFYDAENPAYYERQLPKPALVVWILSMSGVLTGYVKRRLIEAGWKKNVQVQIADVTKFDLFASTDGLRQILYDGKPFELPDCVVSRVSAKVSYFGLAVIRQFEKMGVVVLNDFKSVDISRDKLHTLQTLAAHGIPIPKTIVANFPLKIDIEQELKYPMIIKKTSGSQGKGVLKVDSRENMADLEDLLDKNSQLILQEFIQHTTGRDIRVFVIGGVVVGSMMRTATKGFKSNVHQGGKVKAVKLDAQIRWLVLETVKLIGLDIAGVDLLIDKDNYKVCEVNSSPGFEGLERAIGVDIAESMIDFIILRLGVCIHRPKSRQYKVSIPPDEENMNDPKATEGASDPKKGSTDSKKDSKNIHEGSS